MYIIDFEPYAKNQMTIIEFFSKYAIDSRCECDNFRIVSLIYINFIYDVIQPEGQTLLILGHLVKLRWLPWTYQNIFTVKLIYAL